MNLLKKHYLIVGFILSAIVYFIYKKRADKRFSWRVEDMGSYILRSSDDRFEIKMLQQHSSKACQIVDFITKEVMEFPCLDDCKEWAQIQLSKNVIK